MKTLLAVTAVAEAATGSALFIAPGPVTELLLGAAPSGVAIPLARFGGIALFALAVTCWPDGKSKNAPHRGMTTYSLLVTIFLFCQGIRGEWVGPLLWPAVVLHAALTLLLAGEGFCRGSPEDRRQGL